MLRKIDFGYNQKRFDLVWEGWLFGTRADQQRNREPNREKARMRAKISRKLKTITRESNRVIVGEVKHRDLFGDTTVRFEQPEHELLVKTLEETDWSPEIADDAFDMIDWISAAEKEE